MTLTFENPTYNRAYRAIIVKPDIPQVNSRSDAPWSRPSNAFPEARYCPSEHRAPRRVVIEQVGVLSKFTADATDGGLARSCATRTDISFISPSISLALN